MQIIIDRIEGDYAVCENEDKTMLNLPLKNLPNNVHEGSVLTQTDANWTINEEQEALLRAKAQSLVDELFQ